REERPVLSGVDLGISFQGLKALTNLNIDLYAGTITGLIGPNGAGKTTLVNVLSGLMAPSEGMLFHFGERVRRWGVGRFAQLGITRTFQGNMVFDSFTVQEHVELATRHAGNSITVETILHRFGLDAKA